MPDYKIKLFVYTAILFQDTASSSSSVAGKVTGIVVIWISAMPRQRKSPEEKLVWNAPIIPYVCLVDLVSLEITFTVGVIKVLISLLFLW